MSIVITKEDLIEARKEAQHAPGVDENDWCEGWDDAIYYLESRGLLTQT